MLKVMRTLFLRYLKRLAHVPHVSCFPLFHRLFLRSPPFIPFTVHLVFITIPTPCISMPLYLSSTTLSPSPISSLICIPSSLFFRPYFSPLYLCLAVISTCPPSLCIQPSLSPPTHTFLPRCVYPTQLTPRFPWKSVSAFFPPSFEAFSRFFQ